MPDTAPEITNLSLAAEEELSFEDIQRTAEEPTVARGPWPRGWYTATIVEGYATPNGTQWRSEDQPSKDGTSRNLRVCFHLKNVAQRKEEVVTVKRKGKNFGPFTCPALAAGEERFTWNAYNYRLFDLTKERIEAVENIRKVAAEEKWQGGRWPDRYSDLQRSSLAQGQLFQLYKAVGFAPKKVDAGFVDVQPLIGQQVDVHLGINEDSYNEITEIAKLGEGGKKKK